MFDKKKKKSNPTQSHNKIMSLSFTETELFPAAQEEFHQSCRDTGSPHTLQVGVSAPPPRPPQLIAPSFTCNTVHVCQFELLCSPAHNQMYENQTCFFL